MSKEDKAFDLENIYDEQIEPLMAQIIKIAQEHKMPMFATFVYKYKDSKDYDLCTTLLNDPDELGREEIPKLNKLRDIVLDKGGYTMSMMVTSKESEDK